MKHLLNLTAVALLLLLGCTKTETIVQVQEPEYKEYVATFDQDGSTSSPTISVINNSLGDIEVRRDTLGTYSFLSDSLFVFNKTVLFASLNAYYFGSEDGIQVLYHTPSRLVVKIYSEGYLNDGTNFVFEIRVYH